MATTSRNTKPEDQPLQEQVAALREDLAGITARISKLTDSSVRQARRKGEKVAADGLQMGEDALSDLEDQLSELERSVSGSVRRNPLQALAIAAGVGFVASFLMRR